MDVYVGWLKHALVFVLPLRGTLGRFSCAHGSLAKKALIGVRRSRLRVVQRFLFHKGSLKTAGRNGQ